MSVVRQSGLATVEYQGSLYRLTHKPSALGERYTSPNATLIIDRRYAVLVTKDASYAQRCYLDGRPSGGE